MNERPVDFQHVALVGTNPPMVAGKPQMIALKKLHIAHVGPAPHARTNQGFAAVRHLGWETQAHPVTSVHTPWLHHIGDWGMAGFQNLSREASAIGI